MLIRCVKCHKKFSDKKKTCPSCGEPVDEQAIEKERTINDFYDLGTHELFQRRIDKYIKSGYKIQKRSDTVVRLCISDWLINIFIIASIFFIFFTVWVVSGILYTAIISLFPLGVLGLAAMREVCTVVISITRTHQIEEKGHILEKK